MCRPDVGLVMLSARVGHQTPLPPHADLSSTIFPGIMLKEVTKKHTAHQSRPRIPHLRVCRHQPFIDPAGPQESTGTAWFAGRGPVPYLGYQGSITRAGAAPYEPGERAKRPDRQHRPRPAVLVINESAWAPWFVQPAARGPFPPLCDQRDPAHKVRKYGAHIEPQTPDGSAEDPAPEALSCPLIKSLALKANAAKAWRPC